MSGNYTELLEQKRELERQAAALDAQLKEAKKAEVAAVITQIKELMKQHDLTLEDLGNRSASPKKSGGTGMKVAPKYINRETGETWSGRGLMPKWLQAKIDSGMTKEQFAA